ncbi:Serine/threonine-protein kinase 4 [Sparganum proliferum]
MKRLEDTELATAPSNVLEIICKLGKGSYGSVFKARHRRTGSIVAVKKVPVDSDLSEIVKEISIMQQCDSQYIVKCYGSLFDNQDLWICMEYCGAGSVADIMRLRNQTLREEEIGTILKYSLLGLDYLHQMRKIHRDIKAGNILLTNSGMAKLADFGVAGQLADTLAKRNTVIGTPYWMAPEVIQEVGYNCSADIWSLGITAIEMADGKPPLGEEHPMRALFMIPSQPSPRLRREDAWSPDFVSFVNSCLSKLPEARPSAADLLATDFVRGSLPCSVLIPLIEESGKIREKRLSKSRSSSAVRQSGLRRSVSPSSEVLDVAPVDTTIDSDQNSGTMISRSDQDTSRRKSGESPWDRDASGTLISLDSVDESSGRLPAHANRPPRNVNAEGYFSDSQGTMIINEGTDYEEEDEDAGGSVLIYDTKSSNSAGQIDNGLGASSPGENTDTLTRNFKRAAISEANKWSENAGAKTPPRGDDEDAAAAVAAAQRDCGLVGGMPAPRPVAVGQRPFAPFSRAFQEGGLLCGMSPPDPNNNNAKGSKALALANEPGGLAKLSYTELEQLLVNLSRDLETELRNLAVRYRHKRQPLLDAIAEKTAMVDAQAVAP